MPKNIIEVGFDYQQTQKEANIVADQLQRILDLGNQIKNSKLSFTDFGTGVGQFKKETEGLLKTQEELFKQSQSYNKVLAEQTKAQILAAKAIQQQQKAEQEQLKTEQQSLKAKKENLSYQQAIDKEKSKGASQAAAEAKIASQLTNEYLQLNNALKDQELKYKNLALTVGFENKETQEALKTALATRSVLDKIDTNLKNNQRNVGNYASAYNGLAVSLQQVLREAPSAAVSLNTFFLAISNNLPMVFDEIKKASDEIKAVKAALQADIVTAREAAITNARLAGATEAAAIAEADLAEATIVTNAAQKATPSLLQRISSALFSFQSLLTVGILLLTLFGASIAASAATLFKAKPVIDDTTKSFDEFTIGAKYVTEALEDMNGPVAEAYQNVDKLTSYVDLATKGFVKKSEVVTEYNETMGKVTGTVKTFAEVEAKLSDPQVVKDYTNAMLYRAAANLALEASAKKSLEAEENRRKKELEFSAGTSGFTSQTSAPGFVPGLDQVNKGIVARSEARKKEKDSAVKDAEDEAKTELDIAKKFNEDAAAIFKKYGTDFLNDGKKNAKDLTDYKFELNKLLLEDEIKTQEEIAKNSLIAFPVRNEAAKNANDTRIQLANYIAKHEIEQEGVTADQVKLINQQKLDSLKGAQIKYSDDLQKILVDRIKIQKEISEEEQKIINEAVKMFADAEAKRLQIEKDTQPDFAGLAKEEIEMVKNGLDAQLTLVATSKAKEETILNAKYAAGKINEDKYQKALLEIQRKYSIQTLQLQITAAKEELRVLTVSGGGATVQADKFRQAIAEAEAALAKLGKTGKDSLTDLVKIFESINQLTQQLGQLISSAADIRYTKERNALQSIEDQRQKNYENEVSRINDSTLSEEDKANKLKILDATRQTQKEQYDRKERELAQRKARFDKAANIANIITATALAVVKALPVIPLAIIAGALGAAQLAIAIATPIPTYAKGLKGNKGDHMGIYGEAGAELVSKPGQSPFIADSATLDFLPSGTTITPINHDTLNSAMHNAMIRKTAQVLGMGAMMENQKEKKSNEQMNRLIKGLGKNKTSVNVKTTSVLDLGWAKYVAKNVRGRNI